MDTMKFMLAGNATFTLRNNLTGNHFTYRIKKGKQSRISSGEPPHFVQLLSGPDNTSDYQFMGTIFDSETYRQGKKSRIGSNAPSNMAFSWLWDAMTKCKTIPEHIDVMHAGKCGRCARKLTDPVSIETGFGPHCRGEI